MGCNAKCLGKIVGQRRSLEEAHVRTADVPIHAPQCKDSRIGGYTFKNLFVAEIDDCFDFGLLYQVASQGFPGARAEEGGGANVTQPAAGL